MKKKIIIIGAGISGISCGINALNHGYSPLILEKNPTEGGLCTAWDRKGFHLDGCVHWLTGTAKNTYLRKMWEDLGVIHNDEDIYFPSDWGSFEYDGYTVTFYSDINKTQEEWIKLFPSDKKHILHFVKLVKKVMKVELPIEAPTRLLPFRRIIRFVKDLVVTFPYYELGFLYSCDRYAKRFYSPALRWAINHAQPGPGNLYSMVFSYATICLNNGGIPYGGSKTIITRMKDKYISLGGEILFSKNVKKVLVENDVAKGVVLSNEEIINGDYVVSCCDANYAYQNLLPHKDSFLKLIKRYELPNKYTSPSCVLVYLLIKDYPSKQSPICFPCKHFDVGGRNNDHLTLRNYDYDPYFRNENGSVVQVFIDQYAKHYLFWDKLKEDREAYLKYKNNIATEVIDRILIRYPSLKDKITVLDVATPFTFTHYVNASRGSYMSYLLTTKAPYFSMSGKYKNIKNYYMSGQYIMCPGGLPIAASSGSFAIQWIDKEEKKSH